MTDTTFWVSMYHWYYFFVITSNVSIFFEIPKVSVFGGFLVLSGRVPITWTLLLNLFQLETHVKMTFQFFLGEKGFCRYQPNYQSRFGVGLFRKAQKILQGHCQYLFFERVPCLLVLYGSNNSIPRKSWQRFSLNTRDISRRNDLKPYNLDWLRNCSLWK